MICDRDKIFVIARGYGESKCQWEILSIWASCMIQGGYQREGEHHVGGGDKIVETDRTAGDSESCLK